MLSSPLFIFILGREFKLSIAEIYSVFPAAFFEFVDEQIAVVAHIPREEIIDRFPRLGGTIKIIEVLGECRDGVDFMDQAAQYLSEVPAESKIPFAVASYREKLDNFAMGLRIKKLAKTTAPDKSFRLVNKDPKNINSAVYKIEHLSKFETEFNSIVVGNTRYIGRTCAFQDVDLYAARDIGKERDMDVGMLPPKLAQTMVNLSIENREQGTGNRGRTSAPVILSGAKESRSNKPFLKSEDPETSSGWRLFKSGIYDPFCGLGTILIEAANMGYKKLLWSDLAPEMVRATETNVKKFIEQQNVHHHERRTNVTISIENENKIAAPVVPPSSQWQNLTNLSVFRADASKLSDFTTRDALQNLNIVTEWYLWEVMSARTVTDDRIASERRKLGRMYDWFFSSLKRLDFSGMIVISFPFWEIRGKYIYLEEWYEAYKRHGFVAQELLPEDIEYKVTKSGSLLYKRLGQIVGREVLKLHRT